MKYFILMRRVKGRFASSGKTNWIASQVGLDTIKEVNNIIEDNRFKDHEFRVIKGEELEWEVETEEITYTETREKGRKLKDEY
jgi:hypothetical protein